MGKGISYPDLSQCRQIFSTRRVGQCHSSLVIQEQHAFWHRADDLLDLEFDCLYGADPIQGKADLSFFQKTFKGKICLWGGINSALTLGRGSKEEIERAVEDAIRMLAPGGGFVLFPVDQVLPEVNPWDNIEILLKRWREIGSYPITV